MIRETPSLSSDARVGSCGRRASAAKRGRLRDDRGDDGFEVLEDEVLLDPDVGPAEVCEDAGAADSVTCALRGCRGTTMTPVARAERNVRST